MDASIKERWLTALRSGEYAQAKHKLAILNDDGDRGFCCLGVLCELAVADEVIDTPTLDFTTYSYAAHDSVLPSAVVSWSELEEEVPDFYIDPNDVPNGIDQYERDRWSRNGEGFYYVNLAELNDNGATFAQIADLIEKYF